MNKITILSLLLIYCIAIPVNATVSLLKAQNTNCHAYLGASFNSFKWYGKCHNGKAHGKGTAKYFNNKKLIATYSGYMNQGHSHGHGTMVWNDGEKYTGQYVNGYMSGKGTYIWPDGQKYVGQWKNDQAHGYGTLTFPDGSKNIGQFRNNEFIGNSNASNKSKVNNKKIVTYFCNRGYIYKIDNKEALQCDCDTYHLGYVDKKFPRLPPTVKLNQGSNGVTGAYIEERGLFIKKGWLRCPALHTPVSDCDIGDQIDMSGTTSYHVMPAPRYDTSFIFFNSVPKSEQSYYYDNIERVEFRASCLWTEK